MSEPWERFPKESAAAFAAFRLYRDLGPRRSLSKARRATYGEDAPRTKQGQLERWSSAYQWGARCLAWDDYVDAEGRAAEVEAVKAMRARHAQMAQTVLHRVMARIVGGEVNIGGGGRLVVEALDPNRLSAVALARLLDVAVKVERMARGEPDAIVAPGSASGEGSIGEEQNLAVRILADPALAEMCGTLAMALSDASGTPSE